VDIEFRHRDQFGKKDLYWMTPNPYMLSAVREAVQTILYREDGTPTPILVVSFTFEDGTKTEFRRKA
jgi:hypothetical protein